jgi:exodeoxyribonuclease VII large subunit
VALEPAAQLAGSRERVGYLLDRAARAVANQLADADRALDRLVDRLVPIAGRRMEADRRALAGLADRAPRAVVARTATARGRLDAVTAAMAALGPQATLDRGYAIVRRTADGTIVRAPGQAAPGTPLRVRVAAGEFDATAGPARGIPGVPDMLAPSPPPEDPSR